jgi:hypothetical protein
MLVGFGRFGVDFGRILLVLVMCWLDLDGVGWGWLVWLVWLVLVGFGWP